MPLKEAIVVNPERELSVPTYNKEQIKDIAREADHADSYEEVIPLVNEGIEKGDIAIPAGGTKLYLFYGNVTNLNPSGYDSTLIRIVSTNPNAPTIQNRGSVGFSYDPNTIVSMTCDKFPLHWYNASGITIPAFTNNGTDTKLLTNSSSISSGGLVVEL